jgi:glycosyltransferase involved in cell wall biosynthesis
LLAAGYVQDGETEDEMFEKLGGHRIESLGRSISILTDLRSFIEIRKYIIECNPDVINTHTAKAGVIGRLAAVSVLRNRPAIVHTYHGHLLYGYFPKWKSNIFRSIEVIIAKISDVLIAAGDKVKTDLINAGIGDENLFYVLRPGVKDFEHLDKELIRRKLNIESNNVVVGWLGRMTKIKRADRAIELAKEFPDTIFLLGGEGELLEEIRLSAPTNVVFLGWTSPETLWSASDIALLTSDNEAQPISLIEASYSSLPIVAQNVGSVSEVVKDGKTGLLVSNFDEAVIALQKLIDSGELRESFGAAGRQYVKSRFSPDQFILGHEAAYSRALRK